MAALHSLNLLQQLRVFLVQLSQILKGDSRVDVLLYLGLLEELDLELVVLLALLPQFYELKHEQSKDHKQADLGHHENDPHVDLS